MFVFLGGFGPVVHKKTATDWCRDPDWRSAAADRRGPSCDLDFETTSCFSKREEGTILSQLSRQHLRLCKHNAKVHRVGKKALLTECVTKMSVNRDFQESDQTLQGGAITERDVNNVENMDSHSNVTGIMSTPQTPAGYIVGMGRGEQLASMIEHRARSSKMSPLEIHRPADGIHRQSEATPIQDQPQDMRQSLVDLVKQLGSEVGAQVASSLANPSNQASDAAFPPPQSSTTMQHHDWSKVNLILKPEIKEPPFSVVMAQTDVQWLNGKKLCNCTWPRKVVACLNAVQR